MFNIDLRRSSRMLARHCEYMERYTCGDDAKTFTTYTTVHRSAYACASARYLPSSSHLRVYWLICDS